MWSSASDIVLKAKPQQCVVLNEGQVCSKTVKLRWHVPEKGQYCLRLAGEKNNLTCWSDTARGEYVLAFHSSESIPVVVVESGRNEPLASVTISVSWVYEARRESRASWRLF